MSHVAGSRLQFVLTSVCYNALVDQSRAGEVNVGGREEHHDEAAMKVRLKTPELAEAALPQETPLHSFS